jgi:eukaryotic-like serine/threonine-protein kinase
VAGPHARQAERNRQHFPVADIRWNRNTLRTSNRSGEAAQQRMNANMGRYRLLAQLGTGGMADVYLAMMRGQRGLNKLVVVKIPRDSVIKDPSLLTMFLDEARLAARLSHPNVVQTYEVVREGDRDMIVMEYLEGHSLHEVLVAAKQAGKKVPLWMHLHMIAEGLNGLHYAHGATDFDGTPLHLVHRDVSPHNLFVTFDAQVKVLDFGVAKAATSQHETQSGTFKGKVRYMPVEQLMGGTIDHRADLFAVGAMLWEAAVGERLWKGKTDVEVMTSVVSGDVRAPKAVNPEVPDELDAICRRALAHDKENRYATALELQADLEAFIATLPDRKGRREVSATLTELFGEARAERKRVIEAQLSKADGTGSGDYEVLEAGALPQVPTSLPTLVAASSSSSSAGSRTNTPVTGDQQGQSGVTSTGVTRTPRSSTLVLVVGAVVVAAVAGGVFATSRSGAGNQEPAAPVVTLEPPPVVIEAPRPGEIALVVRAHPTSARLFLDGEPLPANPTIRRLPKDGSTHEIRAEAEGYETGSTTVTLEADKDVVIRLDKSEVAASEPVAARPKWRPVTPKDAGKAPATAAPPPPPPPTEKPAPTPPGGRTARPVDTSNPWEK